MVYTIKPIAHIENDFKSRFGIPRQSGLADRLFSTVVFEKEFGKPEALRGLWGYSHLWLIWYFSENADKGWSPTVRPPRLGGNRRMGVFATRSPFRPNPLGLSSVKIHEIKVDDERGPVIIVSGADLMDGTPIFDIKPYITMDQHDDAVCGFQEGTKEFQIQVEFPTPLLRRIPEEKREGLRQILSQDPRPAYQNDPQRIYGITFCGFDIRFSVDEGILTVVDVVKDQQSD